MIGAIAGDIIGSYWEGSDVKGRDLPLFLEDSTFTDDTILSCAIADSILSGTSYKDKVIEYAKKYADQDVNGPGTIGPGFGMDFIIWVMDSEDHEPYGSFGNGSAMRVSPVAWAYNNLNDVLKQAKASAEITHNHEDGIWGAEVIAVATFLARKGHDKEYIHNHLLEHNEPYTPLDLDYLHETYTFSATCMGSVSEAVTCVLEANSFKETMENVLYIGGDTDTIGAMAGSIAEALYGVPYDIAYHAELILKKYRPSLYKVLQEFESKYGSNRLKPTPIQKAKCFFVK